MFTFVVLSFVLFAHILSVNAAFITTNALSTRSLPSSLKRQLVTVTAQDADMDTLKDRRLTVIIGGTGNTTNIKKWMTTQQSDGSWTDVDYTTGCPARRANWPATTHWSRILTMAAAYHGTVPGAESYAQNPALLVTISKGMDWWFTRDFTNPSCIDSGGTAACPCDTAETHMFNTNWYSNIIGIPMIVAKTCLLVSDQLTDSQVSSCTKFASRTYSTLDHNTNGVGAMTGANLLDVASIGIDDALRRADSDRVADAYSRIQNNLVIVNTIKADGIRADGSFGQHAGITYNGNYGRVYLVDDVNVESLAAGTRFTAGTVARNALSTLVDADRWMIYSNTITNVLHWDWSVLGRFITFPVADGQPSSGILMNLTQIQELGSSWQSPTLTKFGSSLLATATTANAGNLVGNRMFYTNDYMIHRGSNYVTSLKMFSPRTLNTECVNSQNPLGFHLGDGTMYTYIRGDEYEDIAAAWDWNLIPGTTTDYGNTPLACVSASVTGKDPFVGGVSNGTVGVSAMHYINPNTGKLNWQKTWFFLDDDIQYVMINSMTSTSTAPVLSVLDQRRHNGAVYINGTDRSSTLSSGSVGVFNRSQTLWHGGVGYSLEGTSAYTSLKVQTATKTGSWSMLGVSTQPAVPVDLYSAYLLHNKPTGYKSTTVYPAIAYAIYPATMSYSEFASKKSKRSLQAASNTATITALYDVTYNKAYAVFWAAKGGSVAFSAGFTIASNAKAAMMYNRATGYITVSDPSQSVSSVTITVTKGSTTKSLVFTLPTGGLAGSSVTKKLPCCYYP
ncbi:polysaccharide lyase family 8 protein [Mycena floridula]|nr:polysaccharide lyase family 8 protein [Mycena floridula]